MKALKQIAIGFAVAGISLSAFAAEQITPQIAKEKNYQLIGTVTSKNEATSPSGLEEALSKKADKNWAANTSWWYQVKRLAVLSAPRKSINNVLKQRSAGALFI